MRTGEERLTKGGGQNVASWKQGTHKDKMGGERWSEEDNGRR